MGENEEERKDQDGVWDTQVIPPLLNPDEDLRPSHSGGSHSPALYSHATFPAQDSSLSLRGSESRVFSRASLTVNL